jgi:hypothetical protein
MQAGAFDLLVGILIKDRESKTYATSKASDALAFLLAPSPNRYLKEKALNHEVFGTPAKFSSPLFSPFLCLRSSDIGKKNLDSSEPKGTQEYCEIFDFFSSPALPKNPVPLSILRYIFLWAIAKPPTIFFLQQILNFLL